MEVMDRYANEADEGGRHQFITINTQSFISVSRCSVLDVGFDSMDSVEGSDGDEPVAKKSRFKHADSREIAIVEQGGLYRSEKVDEWSRRCFDDWRRFKNLDLSRSIEDLSEDEENLQDFVNQLSLFFLEVRKVNGELYPGTSIQSLFRGIGRLIRHRQEQRLVETGIAKPPFNILVDPRYRRVKVAADQAVTQAVSLGIGRTVQKSDILTVEEERRMLDQAKCSIDSPQGCNYRFAYFCLRNFFIRAASELRNLNLSDFAVVKFPTGDGLRYTPGLSKNWKVDVLHCGPESFRQAVDCPLEEVIRCFERMVSKRPLYSSQEEGPFPMFLTPRRGFKFTDHCWYTKGAVGVNTLSQYTVKMCDDLPDIDHKKITNKTGRGVGITRMIECAVPERVGMRQTGHRDPSSYGKYDQSEKRSNDHLSSPLKIISGEMKDGRRLTYEEARQEEIAKCEALKNAAAMVVGKENCDLNLQEEACNVAVQKIGNSTVTSADTKVVVLKEQHSHLVIQEDRSILTTSKAYVDQVVEFNEFKKFRDTQDYLASRSSIRKLD